ncbi:MAG TPA: hypothetical protein VIC52_05305, partial [Actinomycetota bacterium]
MATKTSPSRRSTPRSSTRSRSTPRGKEGTRSTAPSKRAARSSTAKRKSRRAPATQILSPFARDALGIALMVLAGLAVLSVWFDAAGPMGEAFSR